MERGKGIVERKAFAVERLFVLCVGQEGEMEKGESSCC